MQALGAIKKVINFKCWNEIRKKKKNLSSRRNMCNHCIFGVLTQDKLKDNMTV